MEASQAVNERVVDPLAFYREALWRLGEHAMSGGTAQGAATVLKHVAAEFGLDVQRIPLPRLSRSQREALKDSRWTP